MQNTLSLMPLIDRRKPNVLLREEPDEEEDEGNRKEDDEDEDTCEGYSE